MQPLQQLRTDLRSIANPEKAEILSGFFKTGKGQYGEGDIFLGVMVPQQRRIAKEYGFLSLKNIETLLASRVHEHRLVALLILVQQYRKADIQEKETLADFYLDHATRINNWDLVDLSAPYILGEHLCGKDAAVLFRLAVSENLWERRIAIIATFAFVRKYRFNETLGIAETLLHDQHDLIHKAVGWMLREVGKRDMRSLERFLKDHAAAMPRTMLRYAIERFTASKRQYWLGKKAGGRNSAVVR